jgi:hypothetical protein
MRRSWTTADDDVGIDGLGELERLVLSEIDRLALPEQPRPAPTRRHARDVHNGGDQRTAATQPLDSDPGVAVEQIVGWLVDRPDRDAVVADLLSRLGIEIQEPGADNAIQPQADADTVPPAPAS